MFGERKCITKLFARALWIPRKYWNNQNKFSLDFVNSLGWVSAIWHTCKRHFQLEEKSNLRATNVIWQASTYFDHTLMNLLQRAKPSILQQSAESGSTSALMSPTWHSSAAGDGPAVGGQEREWRERRRRKGKDRGLCSCWTRSQALVRINCELLWCDLLVFLFFWIKC